MIEEIKNDFSKNDLKEIGLKLKDPIYKDQFFEFLCIELEEQAKGFGYPVSQIVKSKIAEYEDFVKNLPIEEVEAALEEKKESNTLVTDLENYLSGTTNHNFILEFIDDDFVDKIINIDSDIVKKFFEKTRLDISINQELKSKFKKYQFDFIRKNLQKKEDPEESSKNNCS